MFTSRRTSLIVALLISSCLATSHAWAGEFRYPEARHAKGELRYIDGLPVLSVCGTPEEIGEQTAALTAQSAEELLDYPKAYLRRHNMEGLWPILINVGRLMLPAFPRDYQRELEAAAVQADLDRDLLIVGNTMFDLKKIGGCSTLLVEPARSSTGGTLLGRNLDFPTLGVLEKYTLVIVCRPEGKRAFASVGFPGMLGCLSGMNDAGLAIATLEVYSSADGAGSFNPLGMPYAMCFRRILEECATVAEAEKLLGEMKRTTPMNLAICDRTGGGVIEMTPRSVVFRPADEGLCACTNHFRTSRLATRTHCERYDALCQARTMPRLGPAEVTARLHAAHQGKATFQTMIFEPAALKLNLALGPGPSTALPLRALKLKPLFER